MYVCMDVDLFYLAPFISIFISACLSVSVALSVCFSVYLCNFVSLMFVSVWMSACLSVWMIVCTRLNHYSFNLSGNLFHAPLHIRTIVLIITFHLLLSSLRLSSFSLLSLPLLLSRLFAAHHNSHLPSLPLALASLPNTAATIYFFHLLSVPQYRCFVELPTDAREVPLKYFPQAVRETFTCA